ncbi:MAG: MBL fold metallo-hydrolase [Thermoplasmata archaeon]|nr:MAG: MBL fold metallo-hydrolase [Thermoplasmata archaeon]
MKLTFLGGASEVGSLGIVMDLDSVKLLLDYGMTPTTPPKFPMEAPPIDAFFLSHCHVDHSGMVPWVCSQYKVPMYTSYPTFDVSELLIYDSLKISKYEGYPLPYTKSDVRSLMDYANIVEVDDYCPIRDIEINFHSAGHVPGSLMAEISGDRTTLFTGDINTIDTRLLSGTKPVKCDTLITESTYAGRDHEFRLKIEKDFLEKIDEVVDRGGIAIVPAFAVGRTQELLMVLTHFDGEIWLDGMGDTVSRMYFKHPDFVSNVKKLKRAYRKVRLVKTSSDRKRAQKGDIILTTSGMLDGGPVMEYLKWLKDDPKNALILTGYQVEGTNGRLILDEGMMDFYGVKERLNCEICFFDFSAHAGHKELVEFIRKCDPENLVLCHGDNRDLLREEFGGEMNTYMPKEGKPFEI